MDFLSPFEFRQCVQRYNGNYKIKSFSCWDQFLCMAFAQLTFRESLRDIQACLRATPSRLYHAGIRGKVSRNTLAHANQVRDWRIHADFAQILIARARALYATDSFGGKKIGVASRLSISVHYSENLTGMQCFHELPDGPDLQVVKAVTARSAIDADHAFHLDAAGFR